MKCQYTFYIVETKEIREFNNGSVYITAKKPEQLCLTMMKLLGYGGQIF